jgi:predicted AAA+ superfamily ATPase
VVLLGSAPLLIAQGMKESLAGRFELLHLPHWSFSEMRSAFGFSLEQYLYFGGYPGGGTARRGKRSAGSATSSTALSRRRYRATCCC